MKWLKECRKAYLLNLYLGCDDPARDGTGVKATIYWLLTFVLPFAVLWWVVYTIFGDAV